MGEINYPDFWGNVTRYKVKPRLENLKRNKIIIPYSFVLNVQGSAGIYLESINAYICGFDSYALFQIVRSMEIAFREKLRSLKILSITKTTKKGTVINIDLDDADLFKMTESRPDLLKDRNMLNYFRSIRNKIHGKEKINDTDALYAIETITKEINNLFNFESAVLSVTCPHPYCQYKNNLKIKSENYFIGNEFKINCEGPKSHGLFNNERSIKVTLDGVSTFSIAMA
jgi:hypothetical protein